MAEIRVRQKNPVAPWHEVDSHGHPFRWGVQVLIIYREGAIDNGTTRWNEPRQLGCICPHGYATDDEFHDPRCPLPYDEAPDD